MQNENKNATATVDVLVGPKAIALRIVRRLRSAGILSELVRLPGFNSVRVYVWSTPEAARKAVEKYRLKFGADAAEAKERRRQFGPVSR